jgi:hypothetical protein
MTYRGLILIGAACLGLAACAGQQRVPVMGAAAGYPVLTQRYQACMDSAPFDAAKLHACYVDYEAGKARVDAYLAANPSAEYGEPRRPEQPTYVQRQDNTAANLALIQSGLSMMAGPPRPSFGQTNCFASRAGFGVQMNCNSY